MSCCEGHKEEAEQIEKYTCPMHPEVVKHTSGSCPKCGMALQKEFVDTEEVREKHGHHEHMQQENHEMLHGGSEMAREFLRRFFIVTALLLPLAVFSEPGIKLLGISEFGLRSYLEFGIATIIFYFSLVFFQHAKHEIQAKKYGMMTLVSLGVGAGYLFSAASTFIPTLQAEFYLEISTLIWVLLFGHFLEAKSSSAAGDALKEVAKLLPKKARKIKNGKTIEVQINELQKGDLVRIGPGEKSPADGLIIKGGANFNEAHISGESIPVIKEIGNQVVAGAICIDGSVDIKLDKVGDNSTIGQIKKLIAQAQQTKPSVQKLADKVASILTFTALSVSILTLLVWSFLVGETLVFSATLAITVLVIACPHALGLAIPTVSTIATSLAVKNGLFIKDLAKIEVVKDADYVIFDKTGTLTEGKFGVTDIVALQSDIQTLNQVNKKEEILRIAASLEKHSTHVLAAAILKEAESRHVQILDVTDFKNLAGKGIQGILNKTKYTIGNRTLMEEKKLISDETEKLYEQHSKQGKTIAYVANDRRILGLITLADRIKKESKDTVANLHKLGVKVAMLTGDSHEVAQAVAGNLSLDTYFAKVLPDKKYEYVKKLQDEGNKVIMVGDGVNDAPALSQANVGVAIGAGTDLAVEAGDVVLTRNNPEDAVRLIVLSKQVYRKMVENLIWAAGYNILAIPAAAGLFIPFGFRLTPAFGALLMSLSSVIVVINAMTLKKAKLQL